MKISQYIVINFLFMKKYVLILKKKLKLVNNLEIFELDPALLIRFKEEC
jgi:hypothetical protein